jgi:type IV pilus assembly protein PilZ
MEEQRKHQRTQAEIPVTYQLSDSDAGIAAVGTDISFGGMFIESGEVPAFGAEVMIRARLPGQTAELTLPGIVRWVKPTGFGVQFGLLGVRETHTLTQFLRTRP